MDTKIWKISTGDLGDGTLLRQMEEIKTAITYGEVIGLPTETVYGLAGDATNPEAIRKIFHAKGRPADNPLIVHVHSIDQLLEFTEISDSRIFKLMEHFWPGPISFILPLKGDYISSKTVADLGSVAVRMPSHAVARKIIEYVEVPLAAPSANISGKPSPTDFTHVIDDLNGKVYGVVESESADFGIESTVLDCTTFPFKIARPGEVSKSDLEEVLDTVVDAHHKPADQPISPGMKYKHYAPRQPLVLVDGSVINQKIQEAPHDHKMGVIAPEVLRREISDDVKFVSLCMKEDDYREAARNLYGALRIMDKSDVDRIYIYGFRSNDRSQALLNRIYKATGGEVITDE